MKSFRYSLNNQQLVHSWLANQGIAMSGPVVVRVSSSGKYFSDLTIRDGDNYRKVDLTSDAIHPYLKKVLECKTHRAVLEFLKGLTSDVNCTFLHDDNSRYPSHDSDNFKFYSHNCSAENLISFVELEMKLPNVVFNKIEKTINKSMRYLNIGTSVYVLGTIPAIIKVVIGLSQVIGGLALAILSALPAYGFQSEAAKIIVKRSIQQIENGALLNIVPGVLLAIPGLGQFTYAIGAKLDAYPRVWWLNC